MVAQVIRNLSAPLARSDAYSRITALAELSLFALHNADFEAVMAEATRVVTELLQVELGAVLETAPGGDRFLRRAWTGYRAPPAPSMSPETAGFAAYTLAVNSPVVLHDLTRETRFRCSALAAEKVVSGLCVVIRPPGEQRSTTFGCLFAGSRSHHAFDSADVEFVEDVAAILGAAIGRRRTEEALRASEERFALLSRAMRDSALLLLGPEGSIVSWNPPAEHLLGWRAEDVIGKHVSGLCAEDEVCRGAIDDALRKADEHGQFETEMFAVRRDGTILRVQFVVSTMRGERDLGKVVYLRNITARFEADHERQRLTAELEHQRDTLQAVIEQFPAGVVFHGASDKNIQIISKQLSSMCGYEWNSKMKFDEIIGRFPAWFPDGRRLTVDDYGGVRALQGETVRQEVMLGRADGAMCTVIDSSAPVYDRHGDLVGSVAVIHDVTTEKEAAREVVRLLDEMKRAVCARDDTIAVVSHDLRNPVSVIALAASQLTKHAATLEPDAIRSLAGRVHRAASGADKIIGDLLDFARIEMGRLVVEPSDENARDVVAEAVDAFGELAAQRGISIHARLDDIATVHVPCDRTRIIQVLSNLIGNALKFVPAGKSVDVQGRTEGRELVIAVRDQGPGLRAEQIEHVFDRYWQADSKAANYGLGLGLSIVKGIVEAHGGRVWAESVVGEGATFVFSLPISQ